MTTVCGTGREGLLDGGDRGGVAVRAGDRLDDGVAGAGARGGDRLGGLSVARLVDRVVVDGVRAGRDREGSDVGLRRTAVDVVRDAIHARPRVGGGDRDLARRHRRRAHRGGLVDRDRGGLGRLGVALPVDRVVRDGRDALRGDGDRRGAVRELAAAVQCVVRGGDARAARVVVRGEGEGDVGAVPAVRGRGQRDRGGRGDRVVGSDTEPVRSAVRGVQERLFVADGPAVRLAGERDAAEVRGSPGGLRDEGGAVPEEDDAVVPDGPAVRGVEEVDVLEVDDDTAGRVAPAGRAQNGGLARGTDRQRRVRAPDTRRP